MFSRSFHDTYYQIFCFEFEKFKLQAQDTLKISIQHKNITLILPYSAGRTYLTIQDV
jgi:hypothetical protein